MKQASICQSRVVANSWRQSKMFTRTARNVAKEEISINAQLLLRGGFVDKLMAGVYSYLPLGQRVLWKIENIVRDEMSRLGSQEILMPTLQPKHIWEQTGRWDTVDILFKLFGEGNRELTLGPTHEEVVTPLVGKFINSYKDLPQSVFQIQTKFRNEVRVKSGVLRGREFRMKDMYSFHSTLEDLDEYYQLAAETYNRVFARCGLGHLTYKTFASGGVFSEYSHEFQTVTPHGEDIIHVWEDRKIAVNKEILEKVRDNPEWKGASLREEKAIEVGNIFKLGTKFSDAFELQYLDLNGQKKPIYMGCYGIGTTRLVGTVAEVLHDDKGIIWPEEIAPFKFHLVLLAKNSEEAVEAENLFTALSEAGIEVLYDDRTASPGEKFADSDLIGIPNRLVISPRTINEASVEYKRRDASKTTLVPLSSVIEFCKGL